MGAELTRVPGQNRELPGAEQTDCGQCWHRAFGRAHGGAAAHTLCSGGDDSQLRYTHHWPPFCSCSLAVGSRREKPTPKHCVSRTPLEKGVNVRGCVCRQGDGPHPAKGSGKLSGAEPCSPRGGSGTGPCALERWMDRGCLSVTV